MRAAARAYEDGWHRVYDPKIRILKNDELTAACRHARARYERLVRTRKVFDEILAPDTKH